MSCPICLTEIENKHITKCNHSFCKCCIDTWLEEHNNCPICRGILKEEEEDNSIFFNQNPTELRRQYRFQLGSNSNDESDNDTFTINVPPGMNINDGFITFDIEVEVGQDIPNINLSHIFRNVRR